MDEFQLKMSRLLHNKKMAEEGNEYTILVSKAKGWINFEEKKNCLKKKV